MRMFNIFVSMHKILFVKKENKKQLAKEKQIKAITSLRFKKISINCERKDYFERFILIS